jgi:hypothetical protein
VDDAGAALPDVVEAVQSHGGQVTSAREERLGFDEIFAILVERDRQAAEAATERVENATVPADAAGQPVRSATETAETAETGSR